jgi:anti-anti-sigma factor
MATVSGLFEVERDCDTLIATPLSDLRELDYTEIETGAKEILELLTTGTIKNLVMDFRKTDYYGSTALGFFVKLWKRVRDRNGQMVFCGASQHEKEILVATRLDGLWPIYSSREEALAAVHASG